MVICLGVNQLICSTLRQSQWVLELSMEGKLGIPLPGMLPEEEHYLFYHGGDVEGDDVITLEEGSIYGWLGYRRWA